MRILIVDTWYSDFQAAHYARHPGLESRTYDEQWRSLMGTFFGTADAYSYYLRELGHDAHEFVVDCRPLQRAWLREHSPADRCDDPEETLLMQAESFQPNVVYVQNLRTLTDSCLTRLRALSGFLVGQIASEAPSPERCRLFHLILTSFPHFVERFRSMGIASEYLRIGFDPRVLDALGPFPGRDRDVVFIGALNVRRHGAGNRMIARAGQRMPIDLWGYDLRGWSPWPGMRRRYHGEAWGIDMFRILREARVALNRHITVAEGYANNMRLFEATGVGTLLLTDEKSNLGDMFDRTTEIATYRHADELVTKARYFLEHPDERERVAAAGQRRTLSQHTYRHRMVELIEILERCRP